jgi:hypothetical protein
MDFNRQGMAATLLARNRETGFKSIEIDPQKRKTPVNPLPVLRARFISARSSMHGLPVGSCQALFRQAGRRQHRYRRHGSCAPS